MRRNRLVYFVLLGPLLLAAPVLLAGDGYFFGATLLQFHPWRVFALEALKGGVLPLWNPLSGMGAPLLANYQSALLYPPTWILFLLGVLGGPAWMGWGQGLLVFGHLALAGWGMARLVRAMGFPAFSQMVSGLAYGLSGYLVARSHFMSINAAAAWLPWVLLAVYRLAGGDERVRASLRLVGPVAMLLLAGHAQTAWYTLLLAAFWLLFWLFQPRWNAHSHDEGGSESSTPPEQGREYGGISSRQIDRSCAPESRSSSGRARRWLGVSLAFAGALAFAATISAAQLLPTAELLLESQRAAGAGETFVMTYSFWPWRFLGLLLPGLFGSPVTGDYWGYANFWEDAVYIGLLPFLLALRGTVAGWRAGPRKGLVRALVGLVGVSFLLALGQNTPVFPFLYRHVPTFNLFQAPARFTLWAVFALALLAAVGAQDWSKRVSSYARQRAVRWSAAGLAVLLAGAVTRLFLPGIPASFGRSVFTAGLFGTAAAALSLARKRDFRWQMIAAAVITLDLLVAGWGLNPGTDLGQFAGQSDRAAALLVRLAGGRLYLPSAAEYALTFDRYFRFDTFQADRASLRASLLPNLNLLDGLPSANQFDPLLVGRYAQWMAALDSADDEIRRRLLSEMAVTVVQRYAPQSAVPVAFESVAARPRAEWLPCAQWTRDARTAINGMMAGQPPANRQLLVEGLEPSDEPGCGGSAGSVQWIESANHVLVLETTAETPGWLLLRDTYYPGWTAQIDGETAPIYPANAAFRAVRVPAGLHEVVWRYEPKSFVLGAALSLAGLVGYAVLWTRPREAT